MMDDFVDDLKGFISKFIFCEDFVEHPHKDLLELS